MIKTVLCATLASMLVAGTATAAEIRFAPSTALTLNPTYPRHGYNDLLVHTVAIHTGPHERFGVETVRLDLMKGEQVVASRTFTAAEVVASTQDLLQAPIEGMRNVQFLDPKGLASWFGPGVTLGRTANLGPDQALVLTETYFALNATPDQLRVVVRGRSGREPRRFQAEMPIRAYKSPIDYHFPLKGAWLEASLPILQSHHRFGPENEFAVDFFKVDNVGWTVHDGTADPSHWYAYGEPVAAAADGEVVRVIADQVQDRTFLVPRPGETADQRGERIGRTMQARVISHFPESGVGNLVTLRHEANGVVEYSSYMHLKSGSVRVKVGDHVKQGDLLGEVGDTGDTTIVHLHFQVNAGPDAIYSQSLPFRFSDMARNGSTQDPGWFVQSPQ